MITMTHGAPSLLPPHFQRLILVRKKETTVLSRRASAPKVLFICSDHVQVRLNPMWIAKVFGSAVTTKNAFTISESLFFPYLPCTCA